MASAEELRGQINAANQRLEESLGHLMGMKSEVTDAGVSTNTARAAEQNAIGRSLAAVSELRDGLSQAQAATFGTSDANATAAVLWIQQALDTTENDVSRLKQMGDKMAEMVREFSSITTNSEEAITRVRGAISNLSGYATNRV